ncbi:hypothetical protein BDB00DRAFT_795187 [Zychaea mexicana]|uniref:uncharacterized protein n=1 Tax=Zychaea mexicana TaxID=64656 RepID=UPI0022FEE9B5|nr:uncharacterized protein BDB00DRAFT_795187 [Zychaea mexicana]KAI9499706.1 hypothetical protein BDB00DRAFT_795187 [Zychaea mexicana]
MTMIVGISSSGSSSSHSSNNRSRSGGNGGDYNNQKKMPHKIYHQGTLLRLLAATSTDRGNGKKAIVTPHLLEQYQHDIRKFKLEKRVIKLTNQMIFLQFVYPFHDILNWLTYPIMLLLQIIILYFLWWWPKSENYNTPMKAQTMFSVWIFAINVILVIAAPSVRDEEEGEDDEDEDEDDLNKHHSSPHH